MTADLKTWLEEVSADAGTDVTGHLDSLTSHGAFYTSCGVLTRVLPLIHFLNIFLPPLARKKKVIYKKKKLGCTFGVSHTDVSIQRICERLPRSF